MNKTDAKKIAQTITREQLGAMFEAAKSGIKDWEKRSAVNPVLTIGKSWNVLHGAFERGDLRGERIRLMVYKNMIWEFGDFLPDDLKPKKKARPALPDPFHEEPMF